MLDRLLLVCTGSPVDAGLDTVNARKITDAMLSVFPSVKRVMDVESGQMWKGRSTAKLVDALVRDWNIVHVAMRNP